MLKIQLPVNNHVYIVEASNLVEMHLAEKYFPFTEAISTWESAELHIRVTNYELWVCQGGKEVIQNSRIDSEFDAYKQIIIFLQDNVRITKNINVLHGAVLTIQNKCVLILGQSEVGKSTLSAFLSQKEGCFCHSDDLIFVDTESNCVVPSSEYLYLRPKSLQLMDFPILPIYDSFIDRYKLPNWPFTLPKKIDRIYVLERDNGLRLTTTKDTSAFEYLLQNTYFPYQVKANIYTAQTLSLCNRVDVLRYGNLDEAYNFLAKTCERE